jgi:hypothetical protein
MTAPYDQPDEVDLVGRLRQENRQLKAELREARRELTILLRAEVSALTGLLIKAGVFTAEEFDAALEQEADQLSADYARRFPGFTATDDGMQIDPKVAVHTTRGWKP